MRFIKRGLVSTAALISGPIMGGLAGTLYILLDKLSCLSVLVPPIKPTTDISLNFSNVDLDGIVTFPDGINEPLLKERLSDVQINADVDVPDVVPKVNFDECITPINMGMIIGASAMFLGVGLYHAVSCRKRVRSHHEGGGTDIELDTDSEDYTSGRATLL